MDSRFRPLHSWTFGGLIVAFLHLSLAYFLLCVSVYVFFTSKFLTLFGLYLPCPCNGVFGYKNSNLCWYALLYDWPTAIIYSVVNSALSKLSFDFKNQGCGLDRKLVLKGSFENGVLELEGEASCSSSFHSPLLQNCVDKESGFDAKGKRVLDLKKRPGSRRRRKTALGNRKFSSVLPNDDSRSVAANFPYHGIEMRGKDSESLGSETVREDDFPGE